MKNFISKIVLTVLTVVIMATTGFVVSAQEFLITTESAKIDVTTTREDSNFNLPKSVLIVPIFMPEGDVNLSSTEMYRGLYYYTVDILGFNDIPFHYIVSDDGKVFEGNQGKEERQILIDGIGQDMVVVGYITNSSATKFTLSGKKALETIISTTVNKNAINPESISVSGVKFVTNRSTNSVSIVEDDLFGAWNTDLADVKTVVENNYKPQEKVYTAEVNNITLPEGEIKPGDEFTIQVEVTNTGSNGLYSGTDAELVMTKVDAGKSIFFLNGEWLSITQASVLGDLHLLPYDTSTFEIKMKAPLYIGEVSETFKLTTLGGADVKADPFAITVNLSAPDRQIVEIQNTDTGKLNVRSAPSSVAGQVSQVSPGERYFVLEDAGNGWIKILLDNGSEGWVAGWHLNFIN